MFPMTTHRYKLRLMQQSDIINEEVTVAEPTKAKISNMSIEDFKALVGEIIDEKLASYRLVHVDEQGYMYVLTKDSLLPLDRGFETGLEESIRQGEEGRLINQEKVWSKLGL